MDEQLVYDVGAYNGDDTAYYLLRGYRVVSIEADPTLAGTLQARFAEEIAAGRCIILNVGVSEKSGEAPFYLSDLPVCNSFDKTMATRYGATAREIRVQCRTFQSILQEHGMPFFLKVDIEGLDHLCVLALRPGQLPAHVSFEANGDAPDLVRHLHRLGYGRFRLINQIGWESITIPQPGSAGHVVWLARKWVRLNLGKYRSLHSLIKAVRAVVPMTSHHADMPHNPARFLAGSSGPIPSEVPGPWLNIDSFQHTWISVKNSGILESSWFDVHATHSTVPLESAR